ncbi:hypothetical protein VF_A1081 [Aliivibrio fischeri ES114]|uniref:Uncharacterized protein n=1 Tax=Aliivibrio fischeri (strain ATCC 700601 / ES114) TaxID=312309 RepID=Q5DYJ5_ALIF1|nr:hypothetical protein [Aliivibrio fischeri]AAW88151.1 hypothetical protein VF_A1081 [Aliivibrio fischeri ES114]KLU80623.1 hypothetical protein AB192_02020 [Aliivibrio fischeri]
MKEFVLLNMSQEMIFKIFKLIKYTNKIGDKVCFNTVVLFLIINVNMLIIYLLDCKKINKIVFSEMELIVKEDNFYFIENIYLINESIDKLIVNLIEQEIDYEIIDSLISTIDVFSSRVVDSSNYLNEFLNENYETICLLMKTKSIHVDDDFNNKVILSFIFELNFIIEGFFSMDEFDTSKVDFEKIVFFLEKINNEIELNRV